MKGTLTAAILKEETARQSQENQAINPKEIGSYVASQELGLKEELVKLEAAIMRKDKLGGRVLYERKELLKRD